MNYTKAQVKECLQYLNYCVGEGGMSEEEALEIVNKKDWAEVYKMMDQEDRQRDDIEDRRNY
jgi:hypothetical protein